MEKNIPGYRVLRLFLPAILIFSSCIKDNCRRTYQLFTPVFTKLSVLRTAVRSEPAMPVVNTGKIFIRDNWIFLNEQNKGIHIINNSDPRHPLNTAFINIPGNIDMYLNGNILYADLYCDLLAMDISDPKNIVVKKYLTKTFPGKNAITNSNNPDSINVITGWASHDTTVSCTPTNERVLSTFPLNASSYGAQSNASKGMAGSMARFATVDNYMYTVGTTSLQVIDISEAANPLFVTTKYIGWDIETIFPYNNKLYIGAGNSMSVYDLHNPLDPTVQSWTGHWCCKDPVIVDGNYAYVTLHAANYCGSTVNQMEIYDISTSVSPRLVKTYPLANPQGLSKDNDLLFVCDGKEGLKIYDAADAQNIKLVKQFSGMNTYDVIAANGIAHVVAVEGVYQYDYSDRQNIHLLGTLLK